MLVDYYYVICFVCVCLQVTIESPDLDFVYSDSDQYVAEIAG